MKKTRTLMMAMMLPIAVAVTLPVRAAQYDAFHPQEIITVESGELKTSSENFTVDLTQLNTGVKTSERTAIVKDGQGTLILDENVTMHCPLVVREGTMIIGGGAEKVTVYDYPNLESSLFTVGGLNAELVLDNADVINKAGVKISDINGEAFTTQVYNSSKKDWVDSSSYTTSYVAAVCVGGRDGDGTLTLQNKSSLSFAQTVFAGGLSIAGELPASDANAHISGTYRYESGSELYREQAIRDGAFCNTTWTSTAGHRMSHAVINVLSGSKLNTDIGFYAADAEIYIDGEGSELNSGVRSSTADFTWLGWYRDTTTTIKITNGGAMNVGAKRDANTGEFLDYQYFRAAYRDNSHVVIDVEGEGSSLYLGGPVQLATGECSGASFNLNLKDKATAKVKYWVTMGKAGYHNESNITLEGQSQMAISSYLVMYDNSSIDLKEKSQFSVVELDMFSGSTLTVDEKSTLLVREGYLYDGATLINHGQLGDSSYGFIALYGGSRLQSGEVLVSGCEELVGESNKMNAAYKTGLGSMMIPYYGAEVEGSEKDCGTITIGALLTGKDTMQYLSSRDMQTINKKVFDGLLMLENDNYTIAYKHEIGKNITINYTTDHLNHTTGTEGVAVNGGAILVERGEGEHHEGTIGSYVEHAGETEAAVAVAETTAGSSVKWEGDGLKTVTGETTNLVEGTTVKIGTDEQKGTLTVVQSSTLNNQGEVQTDKVAVQGTLDNNGEIHAKTVVEQGGTLKGSGKLGATTVESRGTMVVGNSPGMPTIEGDLKLLSKSKTVFSVAGLQPYTGTKLTGWESGEYSHITITSGGSLTLEDGAVFVIEFGGDIVASIGSSYDFDLTLVTVKSGTISLSEEALTSLLNNTILCVSDDPAANGAGRGLGLDRSGMSYTIENGGKELHLKGALTVVPEPATATLSLLALAALAARRRRK